jgi:hypothetical protein
MRRERGNIILTALFVSVFLFFLSIALIWTNRQDIALSLTMEHKMKGEAAARSGAMTVYAALRRFDQPPYSMEGTLASGATWKAELVELPPEGGRGPVVLLRCRGTSGPLSSHYTLHLLKSELGTKVAQRGDGRMLGFLNAASVSLAAGVTSTEGENGESVQQSAGEGNTTLASAAKVLYGDFELTDLDLGMDGTAEHFAAYQGPLFISAKIPQAGSPLGVVAYLPVFPINGGLTMAYGPVVLSCPAPLTEYGLSVMTYQNEEFKWDFIPFPIPEPDLTSTLKPIGLLELSAPQNTTWTTLVARAVGGSGGSWSWRDVEPATNSESEALDRLEGASFEIDQPVLTWSEAATTPSRRGHILRGAIAAHGETVYSHAWEYLYKHHSGPEVAAPISPILGSTITRWPCVRRYDLQEKKWTTAWSALKDNGDVKSPVIPDQQVLLVDSEGVCYSQTTEPPRRLVRLEPGGNVGLGDELPEGTLFIYKNQPHLLSKDPSRPGILNLETRAVIGFESLPARIPEISGPIVAEMDNEMMDPGLAELEVSPLGEEMEGSPEMRTVRKEYNLRYEIDPAATVACDDDNLYTRLLIKLEEREPTYEYFGAFGLNAPGSVMARYDGSRWHILPNGLMASLVEGISAPGGQLFCASYPGLPEPKSRYTVVSIDVDHFEFSR